MMRKDPSLSLPEELRAVHLGDILEAGLNELCTIPDRQIYRDVSRSDNLPSNNARDPNFLFASVRCNDCNILRGLFNDGSGPFTDNPIPPI